MRPKENMSPNDFISFSRSGTEENEKNCLSVLITSQYPQKNQQFGNQAVNQLRSQDTPNYLNLLVILNNLTGSLSQVGNGVQRLSCLRRFIHELAGKVAH